MRNFLVTFLKCSECSRTLELSSEKPKKHVDDGGRYIDKSPDTGIAGTDKIEQLITVKPCRCTKYAQEKLDAIKGALS